MPSIRDLSHIVTTDEVKYDTLSSKQCSIYIDIGNPAKTSIIALIVLRSPRLLPVIAIIALRSLRLSSKLPVLSLVPFSYATVLLEPMVLILAPPSRFLVPRNHLSFMLPIRNYYSSNLSVRRRELTRKLTEVTIRPYSLYIKGNK